MISPACHSHAVSTKDADSTTIRLGESADLERLGDEIAELAAHLHAATFRLLVRLHDFDRRGGWAGGFRSCAHLLSWRTGIDLGAAREKVRVARALVQLPLVGDALRRGELSYAKARAITRVATPANEEALLDVARHGTAAQVEKVVCAWRRVDRLEQAREDEDRHARRHLTLAIDDDSTYVLRGRLEPEVGALLERALDAAAAAAATRAPAVAGPIGETLRSVPTAELEDLPTHAQRRADAIGLIAEYALASITEPVADERPGARPTGAVEDPPSRRAARAVTTASSSSCTSTTMRCASARRTGTRYWRTASAFPRKRRAASPATPQAST